MKGEKKKKIRVSGRENRWTDRGEEGEGQRTTREHVYWSDGSEKSLTEKETTQKK